jgi:hypothetical protein
MARPQALPWSAVSDEELAEIASRHHAGPAGPRELVGLAISGGGIRSATFALGVLEQLKRYDLLRRIHYLSTVSGGGYIGTWLTANCRRAADQGSDWLDPRTDWEDSIAHLRRYANYLSPGRGLSGDWVSLAIACIRNTLFVLVMLVLSLAGLLIASQFLVAPFDAWFRGGVWQSTLVLLFIVGMAAAGSDLANRAQQRTRSHRNTIRIVLLAVSSLLIAMTVGWAIGFDPFRSDPSPEAPLISILLVAAGAGLRTAVVRLLARDEPHATPARSWMRTAVVGSLIVTCYWFAAMLWGISRDLPPSPFATLLVQAWFTWPVAVWVAFASLWLLAFSVLRSWRGVGRVAAAALAPIPSVVLLHVSFCGVVWLMNRMGAWNGDAYDASDAVRTAFVWTPAILAFVFAVTFVLLIGMMGHHAATNAAERISWLSARLALFGAGWLIVTGAVHYGPAFVASQLRLHPWRSWSLMLSSVVAIQIGLVGALQATVGGNTGRSARAVLPIGAIVGFVAFNVMLLLAVSFGLDALLPNGRSDALALARLLAVTIAALLVVAVAVDINDLGLNAFYRNRLVRCFLGATRFRQGQRSPDFMGFDDDDDLSLPDLRAVSSPSAAPPSPFHLMNCAVNIGSGDFMPHVSSSGSFTMSALHCGSTFTTLLQEGKRELGFVRTRDSGGKYGAPTLGQAMSISGAAIDPNMAARTSSVAAFLLTVFNFRLSWWFPNPGGATRGASTPRFNLPYIFAELFGGANARSSFLMISDGAHFENLGVYELIRRRCRVIMAIDAEHDPQLAFESLGRLMLTCEELGATISIDLDPLLRGGLWSQRPFVLGRITYADGSPDGTLVYLKAAMTGSEDTALLLHRASHPQFPHDPTSDQFFTDAQFQSYRRLGQAVAGTALDGLTKDIASGEPWARDLRELIPSRPFGSEFESTHRPCL